MCSNMQFFTKRAPRCQVVGVRLASIDVDVRSTLECGGSTPPWSPSSVVCQGGVEPPHSKVLRTPILMRAAMSEAAAKDLGRSTGYVTKNLETPGYGKPYPYKRARPDLGAS